jgi:hypothetical protein
LIGDQEILCYEKLLETNKIYLTNVFKIPPLSMLMLCASSGNIYLLFFFLLFFFYYLSTVDTNSDCSRVVFDDWIHVKLHDARDAENLFSQAILLRTQLDSLVNTQLLSRTKSAVSNNTTPLSFQQHSHLGGQASNHVGWYQISEMAQQQTLLEENPKISLPKPILFEVPPFLISALHLSNNNNNAFYSPSLLSQIRNSLTTFLIDEPKYQYYMIKQAQLLDMVN